MIMRVRTIFIWFLLLAPLPAAAQVTWTDARRTGQRRGALREVVRDGQRAWVGREAIVHGELAGLSDVRPVRRLAARPARWLVEGRADEDGLALARRLEDSGRTATPDLYVERTSHAIDVPPDDPRYGGQWYLETVGIEAAWAIETGDPSVSIVIVDNGCEMTHPDLVGGFVGGRDVRDDDDDPTPILADEGAEHGTACAGIAAGVADNGIGIAGVCPECTLHCVRLLGTRGSLTPISADIAAFEYASEVGARVVSNSWGFAEPLDVPVTLRTVMERLYDEDILIVFAAGNDNRALADSEITGVRGVVNVGALNLFDEVAPFSNFGPSLDLTAPTGTLTTDLTGAFGENDSDYTSLFGGTSSSCPVVAGVAGLLFSADPDASAREVHDALLETTRPAPFATPDAEGHDDLHGYGIVDPAAALARLVPDAVPDAGPPPTDAGALDGGLTDAGVGASDGGCACRAASPGRRTPAALLALVALAWLRRRA